MSRRTPPARIGAICTALWLTLGVDLPSQSQTRDTPTRPSLVSVGTASISGQVVTDDAPGRPLRRVVVTAAETAGAIVNRLALTDDAGRFVFPDLPSGRYVITARRPPFLTGAYGARRIANVGSVQTGTAIAVAADQHVRDIVITLLRGAVVTGVVRDANGQPASGFSIGLAYFQRSTTTGERSLTQYWDSGGTTATTDDRGAYRLYGLSPGEYVVSASAGYGRATDLIAVPDAEIQRVFDLLQRPGSALVTTIGPAAAAATSARRPTMGYVPVYFPGTPIVDQAVTIKLGAGEERTGIDFQAQLIATAVIEGRVTGLDGGPAARVTVRAANIASTAAVDVYYPGAGSATTDSDGRFRLPGVAPGRYMISARTPTDAPAPLWAAREVTTHGEDAAINLSLAEGVTVTGRVTIEALDAAPPSDLSRVRVSLVSRDRNVPATSVSASAHADGRFQFSGVIPGRYAISATLGTPTEQGGWFLKAATIGGDDALDVPVEIAAGQPVEAAVTLTDRTTTLLGTMTDAANAAAPEYFIIVFAADSRYWTTGTRRIRQTRPAHDGRFSFRNLPPGDYRLAAVTEVQQGEWLDPEFLTQLLPLSIPVTLGPNEGKTQDIRLR